MMRKFAILLALFAIIGCRSSKKSTMASNKNKLDAQFKLYEGTKYRYGGTDKSGFDCSGYVNKVYKDAFSIQLPRMTKDIAKEGKKVSKSNLKPGDLVFFRPTSRYRHVGIYMGNGEFMHSSTSKGVIKSRLDNVYWKKKYRYARRILSK
ncbi:MAG: NlpC/P60 family protein [Flavobacteriaceae bacterium]|nr:NlpC/P60 family protein [Flavobacteriaceae bacterium]